MAKQLGHVKYKGTIGEIRHFKIKGLSGNFAGLNGGASGEQIKNDAAFVRTRENMNEFGGCASAARSVRVGLNMLMKQMSDPQLTGRLTAIMKKINLEDQSEARGVRAILISQQGQYLKGLSFNRNINFDGVFYAPYSFSYSGDRDGCSLEVQAFNPQNTIKSPAGATHFRLINAISIVSDYAFNPTTGTYEPMEPALNELSKVMYSNFEDLRIPFVDSMAFTAAFDGPPAISSNVAVLCSVGIEFYQQAGGNYYLLNSGNALKIHEVI